MTKPLVSIIIPVYNAEQFLGETIRSVLAQTWDNKEIILVDDGSADRSVAIAKEFELSCIKIICQENSGASAARNKGLSQAKGDYIQFLDADDLLSPDKIEKQIACLEGFPNYIATCTTVHFENGKDHLSGIPGDDWFRAGSNHPVDFLIKLYAGEEVLPGYGGMIQPNSWLTPRSVIEKAGEWNEKLSVDDDGEFFCRVVLAADGVKFCGEVANYYRKFNNQQSLSGQRSKKGIESEVLSIDLKYSYLKAQTSDTIVDRVFAKHYWWTGVIAYPRFKILSNYCITKAMQLGYSGEKYVGGPAGHLITKYFGWKLARIVAHYRMLLKKS